MSAAQHLHPLAHSYFFGDLAVAKGFDVLDFGLLGHPLLNGHHSYTTSIDELDIFLHSRARPGHSIESRDTNAVSRTSPSSRKFNEREARTGDTRNECSADGSSVHLQRKSSHISSAVAETATWIANNIDVATHSWSVLTINSTRGEALLYSSAAIDQVLPDIIISGNGLQLRRGDRTLIPGWCMCAERKGNTGHHITLYPRASKDLGATPATVVWY